MCGITAFTGKEGALPFLLQGLEKLEYRGYDSAGITLVDKNGLFTRKTKGRLQDLKDLLKGEYPQKAGIGHTRWATHGVPSQLNSHPHTNEGDTISIVHNGIIENYQSLKKRLVEEGINFVSQTDSEVIVHLIDYFYKGDMKEALLKTLSYLEGSFAICAVCTEYPEYVYVAKKEMPMVLGQSKEGTFCASDIPALLEYTKDVLVLEDGQMAVLSPDSIESFDFNGNPVEQKWKHIPYDISAAQKGGFETFMLKEMHEQPTVIHETLRGRLGDGVINMSELDELDFDYNNIDRIYLVACGTAYHASLYAQSLLQKWCNIPVFCIPASEFRYGDPALTSKTLCIYVSQSGETADTLAALKMSNKEGATSIAITNVLGSSLSRLAHTTMYTCAGPEIAVASTKAYTTQLVLLACVVIKLVEKMGKIPEEAKQMIQDLRTMPDLVEKMLDMKDQVAKYAMLLKDKKDAYFIGRQLDHFSVLEGALKLKEISYIHADAYYAGELKHGPIALIEKDTVVVALATQPNVAAKTISNIQETIARGAQIILITNKDQKTEGFDKVLYLPKVNQLLAPIPVTILLQELAYFAAKEKGCDVDKPRNLAKSVTVE